MDLTKYGTFAEIGAGQEVARAFFRVGGASGTIAKTISAYDMTFSDAIYGPSVRYVSRQRLQTMLDYEFGLLRERLGQIRGTSSQFFAFADTVTARSYKRQDYSHGWMGIQFQTQPKSDPSQIIIHVRMRDKENVQQQEALGIIGVNLIYAAFYLYKNPSQFICSLLDNLTPERIDVDLIKFSGPEFDKLDPRLMSLLLVENGLTDAALFLANGEVVQPSELLYQKSILVERGSFRPVNSLNLDMLSRAREQFLSDFGNPTEPITELMEITMRNLLSTGKLDHCDFLMRADLLALMGKPVLISNYSEFYRLAGYLSRYTNKPIGIVAGAPALREIFQEKYYSSLPGGILESFGRLFKTSIRLYIHPSLESDNSLTLADNFTVEAHLQHLYAHLLENRHIEFITKYDPSLLHIHSPIVLKAIQNGDPSWETMVPSTVAHIIKEKGYFGYQPWKC